MIYAVQVIKTGNWYIVEEKTPARASNYVRDACTICGKPGIPGLIRGAGKCQYHWNAGVWGKEYADSVRGG